MPSLAVFLLTLAVGASNPSVPATAQAAQTSAPAPAASPAASPVSATMASEGRIPADTVVILELVDTVSSKVQARGDMFALRLAEPILSGDKVLVPVGTPAVGEVIHAQKASGSGRAGELILAARYLDTPAGRIRLRSSFSGAGKDRTKAAITTAALVGVFGLMVHGSDLVLPAGNLVSSKIAGDVDLALLGDAPLPATAATTTAVPPAVTAVTAVPARTAAPAQTAAPAAPTLSNPEGTPAK
jgi:hypothetical protein